MTPQDSGRFSALVGDVYAFYRQDYSVFAGKVWWQAMQPFSFEAVAEAFNRHCVNPDAGQYMPKPADIVRMLQGSTQDAALVAWAKVDRAVRTVGTYRSVRFDDALTAGDVAFRAADRLLQQERKAGRIVFISGSWRNVGEA